MGWTSYKINTSAKTDEVLRRELNCTSAEHGTWEVLESATVGAQWYGIIKRTPVVADPVYYAMIVLTERKPIKGSDMTEFGFKEMTEDMGPYYYGMPLRMLNKLETLVPVVDGFAAKWREGVRMHHARKAAKAKAKRDNMKKLQDFIKGHAGIILVDKKVGY
jgi:hypothetical protein